MEFPWSKLALVGLLLAGVLMCSVRAQPEVDRPPWVPIENWIVISESVGIVIRDLPRTPTSPPALRGPNGVLIPLPPNAIPLGFQTLEGVLVAKHSGRWVRIDMPVPPAQLEPLDH